MAYLPCKVSVITVVQPAAFFFEFRRQPLRENLITIARSASLLLTVTTFVFQWALRSKRFKCKKSVEKPKLYIFLNDRLVPHLIEVFGR